MISVTPVYDGLPLHHATVTSSIGGRDLTEYLATMLTERGYSFTTMAGTHLNLSRALPIILEKEIVREIKEKLCYIAQDFDSEISQNIQVSHTLPDGQIILLNKELYYLLVTHHL
jgi:actin